MFVTVFFLEERETFFGQVYLLPKKAEREEKNILFILIEAVKQLDEKNTIEVTLTMMMCQPRPSCCITSSLPR
jgi:hypothetical protein